MISRSKRTARREYILSVAGDVATIETWMAEKGWRTTWETLTESQERQLWDIARGLEKTHGKP